MSDYLSADEAAEFLGVQRSTLYAYVSRGLLESVAGGEDGRQKRYRRRDLERLKRKSDAKSGEGPEAGDALHWGTPTLETRISDLGPRGPSYRGTSLRDLVEEGRDFEEVAEWLWRGEMPAKAGRWEVTDRDYDGSDRTGARDHVHPLEELLTAVQEARLQDPRTYAPGEAAAFECSRQLIKGSVLQAGLHLREGTEIPDSGEWSVARSVCWAMELPTDTGTVDLIDRTLVVVADHGLNASTFAGRVAASTEADLYACVLAALSAFSGPRHGLHAERVRTFLRAVESPDTAEQRVREELRRGRDLPGFGHPVYEHGDPRFEILHSAAAAHPTDEGATEIIDAVASAASEAGLPPPNLDVALCSVAEVLELPLGGAPFVFAVGRMAGWLAHALEQRRGDFLLRPRSIYVG